MRTLTATLPCALATALLVVPAARAQQIHATVSGSVTGAAGAPLEGATVVVSSPSAAMAPRIQRTDAAGEYRLALLPPRGDYTLEVTAEGYEPVSFDGLVLLPGRVSRLDLQLSPRRPQGGGDAERTETPLTVDVGHTATDTNFTAELLDGVPLLGRAYQDVLTLAPGVTDVDGTGNPNINGTWSGAAQTRLDGALDTDPGLGGFGQTVNLEALADVQVISTGAPAPFGWAQGGFTNLTTRSGGNRLSGALKLFYRSDLFDDGGTGSMDFGEPLVGADSFDAVQPFLGIGGPILEDRAWYFVGLEYGRSNVGGVPVLGARTVDRTADGWNNFVRFSGQAGERHRLSLEIVRDTLGVDGLGLDPLTAPESAYRTDQDLRQGTIRWDWTVGPDLLLETLISGHDAVLEYAPETDAAPCPVDAQGRCILLQDDLYTYDLNTGVQQGPYYQDARQDGRRLSLRSDVTWLPRRRDGKGHTVRAGLEAAREDVDSTIDTRAVRFDDVSAQGGTISFLQPLSPSTRAEASSERLGLYIEDDFKPIPSLSIRLGLRYDLERLEADGFTAFDPSADAERFLQLYAIGRGIDVTDTSLPDAFADAQVFYDINGDGLDGLHCAAYDLDGDTFGDGMPDGRPDDFFTLFDGDFDGVVDPDDPDDTVLAQPDGIPDGMTANPFCDHRSGDTVYLVSALTRHQLDDIGAPFSSLGAISGSPPGTRRQPERFHIDRDYLSPRLSVAWDPWKDGKTQFFGTWGRYYGRIPLGLLLLEAGPDARLETYDIDDLVGGDGSAVPIDVGQISTYVIDRDLKTPHTDEWTVGAQRQLGNAWSASLVYVNRSAEDQIQDIELNHFTADEDGDGQLDGPPGVPNLYVYNAFFAEVYGLRSVNASEYESLQLSFERRMQGRWQLIASYVYSEANGNAEVPLARVGDDVSSVGKEYALLSFDATHVVKVSGVAMLPALQTVGGAVRWSSGTPYSIVDQPVTGDIFGNPQVRTIYPTGERSSESNGGAWNIDLSYRKLFAAGPVHPGVAVEVFNVLNTDQYRVLDVSGDTGTASIARDFGRRWQVSFQMTF
jgi:hypothetical protein